MNRSTLCGAAAILGVCSSPGVCQSSAKAPGAAAPEQFVAPLALSSTNAVLRTGTELRLRLLDELNTMDGSLRPGTQFRLETSSAVVVNGVTVIPARTPAIGVISNVENKDRWGKSGMISAELLYLTVNSRQIALGGGFDDQGGAGGLGGAAASVLAKSPVGYFLKGRSAHLPAGSVVTGFINEDVPLAIQVPPMVIAQSAPDRDLAPVAPFADAAIADTELAVAMQEGESPD